jgi:ABC-2 type transport system ATP-binding protein
MSLGETEPKTELTRARGTGLITSQQREQGGADPNVGRHWTGPMIELHRLHRVFGMTHAVNDVSFTVPRGGVFGYIGPNGAGKTTSMRILATLESPTSGDAFIEGLSSVNDPDKVRSRLGFMPDNFGSYPDTNCVEYLDFFARAHGLVGRERTKRLRWVMDFTGLKPLADKPMRGLSKGMKQRLCLGRALVHDPAVLILDEPAAGLDPRARIELRRIIGSLAAEGKTLLISSHILTELAEMCDSVAILECGRLLATGSVDEIRRRLRPSRDLFVRFRGAGTTVVELLQKLPFVQQVRNEPLGISFTIDGGDDEQVSIARYLIEHQVEVLEYTPREKSLEDVFLQVTEGRVQ